MGTQIHWKHINATSTSDRVVVESANPSGTQAFIGGGWAGGDGSNNSTSGQDAGVAPILAQYPTYDSGTDTTVWTVVFAVPLGTTMRLHVFAVVETS